MPSAISRLSEVFFGGKGKKSKKKSDGELILLVLFVIILAILSGYFTASAIMKKADREYDAFEEMRQKEYYD